LFCGAGGTSTGVEEAVINGKKCAKVVICVNHDKNAIISHLQNHPDTLHFTEDIRVLALMRLRVYLNQCRLMYPNARVVLWASLECTNFSKAKGGQPRDADSRTLADHLFRYIEAINPDYIQIENVEEFMGWGDMDDKGHPISKDKGRLYDLWVKKVKKYGYNFDHRILNAADYGAYTTRKRFFGIFAKYGYPIIFPQTTYSKKTDKKSSLKPWKPVKDVLDFSDEGNSIFSRKKPLVEHTLERIYAGLIKFVAGGKDSFIQQRNSGPGKSRVLSIDRPARTVTTTGGNMELVKTCFLSKQFSGAPGSKNISVNGPAGAITTIDHHAFISTYYGHGTNQSLRLPSPTVLTKDRLSLVRPFFANYYSGGGQLGSVLEPCAAVLTNPKQRLVNPVFIDQQFGKSKPTSINKPVGCVTTNPKYAVVSCKPWIMDTSFKNIGSSIDKPSNVITANRKWHYLMNPQFNSAGGSIDKPCFTLIARMDKMPPYLIAPQNGVNAITVLDTDSPMTVKIKQFMIMYGIIDIKMRMLKIPELKKIMGFPEDYKLIGTQAEQKKFIGNAVEVNMAKVLCESLCNKLLKEKQYA